MKDIIFIVDSTENRSFYCLTDKKHIKHRISVISSTFRMSTSNVVAAHVARKRTRVIRLAGAVFLQKPRTSNPLGSATEKLFNLSLAGLLRISEIVNSLFSFAYKNVSG
jgi:hypothetical protein